MGDHLFSSPAFKAGLSASLAFVLVILALATVYLAWAIVMPLIVAVFLATALWPWVSRISAFGIGPKHWRLPRIVAAGLIYLATLVTAGVIVWAVLTGLIPQVNRLFEAFPQQSGPIREYLEPFRTGDLSGGAARVAEGVAKEAARSNEGNNQNGTADQGDAPVNVGALAIGLFGGIVTLALVLVFTFFLLLDGDRFAQWIIMALPRDRRAHVRTLGLAIRDRISRWVLAQIIYATISGVVVGGFMWLIQIPSPWLYGVLAVLLAVFPGIGPAFSVIPALLVAVGMEPWQPIAVVVFGLVLYIADTTTVSTKIYGEMLRLPMFVVLLAVFLGAILMGVWGALIAPIVAVAIQVVTRDYFWPAADTSPE